jgi:RecG-like helicase
LNELNITDWPLAQVPGMNPRKLAILHKECGMETVGDLLSWYPFRYIDRTRIYTTAELQEDMPYIQLVVRVDQIKQLGAKNKQRLSVIARDQSGSIELVWFQGVKYIVDKIKQKQLLLVFGKPTLFNGNWNISHPEFEPFFEDGFVRPVHDVADPQRPVGLRCRRRGEQWRGQEGLEEGPLGGAAHPGSWSVRCHAQVVLSTGPYW